MAAHKLKPVEGIATVIYLDKSYQRDAFVQLVGEATAVVAKGCANVILNMDRLPAITSEGIGLLVLVNDKCLQGGGKLVLCNVQDRVKHVIKLAGLTRFFEAIPTEEEAISRLKEEAGGGTEAEAEAAPAAAAPVEAASPEEALRAIIANTIKSRAHDGIIKTLSSRSFKTASVDDIASHVKLDHEKAVAVCKDLVASSILTTDDDEIFTFAPSEKAQAEIETFRKGFANPQLRTRLMAWLYSEEKKPR